MSEHKPRILKPATSIATPVEIVNGRPKVAIVKTDNLPHPECKHLRSSKPLRRTLRRRLP